MKREVELAEMVNKELQYLDGFKRATELPDGFLVTFREAFCSTIPFVIPKTAFVISRGAYKGVYSPFSRSWSVYPESLPFALTRVEVQSEVEVVFGEFRQVCDAGLQYDAFYIAEDPSAAEQALVITSHAIRSGDKTLDCESTVEFDAREGSLRTDIWYYGLWHSDTFDVTGDEWSDLKAEVCQSYRDTIAKWTSEETLSAKSKR